MNHLAVLKTLTSAQRRAFTKKSDIAGIRHLLVYMIPLSGLAWLVIERVPYWPMIMLPLGVMIIFLFTLLHETIHKTVFNTNLLNCIVGYACSFLILLPAQWFRCFHFAHHRHTQDPENDPELMIQKPESLSQFILYISGIPVWISHIKTIFGNALGKNTDRSVKESDRGVIILESRIMLAGYALAIGASGLFQSDVLLTVWIIPAILGQPFLRLYLLAEHGHCAYTNNVLENTRTIYSNRLVRNLAWNMPYHVEHHANPGVPFYRLPDLHQVMKPHLLVTERGYIQFFRSYLAKLYA